MEIPVLGFAHLPCNPKHTLCTTRREEGRVLNNVADRKGDLYCTVVVIAGKALTIDASEGPATSAIPTKGTSTTVLSYAWCSNDHSYGTRHNNTVVFSTLHTVVTVQAPHPCQQHMIQHRTAQNSMLHNSTAQYKIKQHSSVKYSTFHAVLTVQAPHPRQQRMVQCLGVTLGHGLVKVHPVGPGLTVQSELAHWNKVQQYRETVQGDNRKADSAGPGLTIQSELAH